MVLYLNTDHPKDVLLFYLAGVADDAAALCIGRLIDEWATLPDWIVGPPQFVHQTEEVTDPSTGEAVVTLGGVHQIYTAHPPWRERTPKEVDVQHYRECERIVRGLEALSREHGYEFHFEFQGELIGRVESGKADDTLDRQFLGAWRQAIGVAPSR